MSPFNGRSLRLPKGSPFRNPQKPIQEKPKRQNQKKPKKQNQKKQKNQKKTIFRDSWKIATEFPRVPKYWFFLVLFFFVFFFFFFFFCFFFFFFWFWFFWFSLDWFCRNLEISLIPFLYYTVQFISLIELSIFLNFYCSWQLMPNLLGLVLVFCFLFA